MVTLKKRVFAIILVLISLSILSFGCKNKKGNALTGTFVQFIDVGQGDCIFINLPDDKKVLIDAGNGTEQSDGAIYQQLKSAKVKTIDYLILTHPDQDHVGGGKKIVESYQISRAYIPYITDSVMPNFKTYYDVYSTMQRKGVQTQISTMGNCLSGEGYFLGFLSPLPFEQKDSSYRDLNKIDATDREINDCSPIIYLEVYGNRFIFTGDAGRSQEQLVLENAKLGIYQMAFNRQINLADVNFLKVAHHGSEDCSSNDFLSVLRPKNAVISVGGNNFYGHPDTDLLTRLIESNQALKVYRTDTCGSVLVKIQNDKDVEIITDAD